MLRSGSPDAQRILLVRLRADGAGDSVAMGMYTLMTDAGRTLGLATEPATARHLEDATAPLETEDADISPAQEATARRSAVLMLQLVCAMCDGPERDMQMLLRGVARAGAGEGQRPDVLAAACRWLLRWEVNQRPSLLVVATCARSPASAMPTPCR